VKTLLSLMIMSLKNTWRWIERF